MAAEQDAPEALTAELRAQFLLDPDVVFLNHGSFGACPRPVLEAQQRLQLEMEREPVAFLARLAEGLLAESRAALAGYLGCAPDEVVYFPNPTTAINMVARSLGLGPGDEVLTTDHEYGAMDRTWRFVCRKTGAAYRPRALPLPLNDPGQVLDALWAGVNSRTRLIFLSHITSPTALIFPIAEVCRRAREAGLLTVIDGAHAPGQVPVDLSALGADIYTGACHKWMCAPKGSAFLYARREMQPRLEPLVVSWGWEAERPGPSAFVDHHEWQGTRDLSPFLSVPEAIRFMREHRWEAVRRACHALAGEARARLHALTGLAPIGSGNGYAQMFSVPLPDLDPEVLQRRLFAERRVEVPVFRWNGQVLMRVSVQAYNTRADLDALLAALEACLPSKPSGGG